MADAAYSLDTSAMLCKTFQPNLITDLLKYYYDSFICFGVKIFVHWPLHHLWAFVKVWVPMTDGIFD
jgi:hypothetical protein